MIDADYLRHHYGQLTDDELRRIGQSDLVPAARTILLAEFNSRGIAFGELESDSKAVAAVDVEDPIGPYSPPQSIVKDLSDKVNLEIPRLVELFRAMVIISVIVGQFLAWSTLLPLPVTAEMALFKGQSGMGAISPTFGLISFFVVQVLLVFSAIGLWLFTAWARPLFVVAYVVFILGSLASGATVLLPWEAALSTIITLFDGAVLALAFLPPLSKRFDGEGA